MPVTQAPSLRKLKVFAFDPGRGRALGNHLTLSLPYERLRPGPVGRLVEVFDWDQSHRRHYDAVDLDDPAILRAGGIEPCEIDLRFHQQMVYAVTAHTIDLFERALGRPVHWPWHPQRRGAPARLRILPHSTQEENAWFDPRRGEMHLGYFPAVAGSPGMNLPGQIVYTCLSYDVVVHLTVHALLEAVLPPSATDEGPDGPALCESFCDVVALLQHFDFEEALSQTIQHTGGRIHERRFSPDLAPDASGSAIQAERAASNPILEVARQFGEGVGFDNPIRRALGEPPDPKAIDTVFEPHERSTFLTAAVFDALFTSYSRRTADLLRLAAPVGPPGALHPDLVQRLAREARKTAHHFLAMCIRALDFCPPFGVQFGDYLRALVTADRELVPEDRWGYRQALIDAFRVRGIRPADAGSYSEEALAFPPSPASGRHSLPPCEGLRSRPGGKGAAAGRRLLEYARHNRQALDLAKGDPIELLGPPLVPSRRVGPTGRVQTEWVATLAQTRAVSLGARGAEAVRVRGGTRLVLDGTGQVRYAIARPLMGAALRRRAYRASRSPQEARPPRPPRIPRRVDPLKATRPQEPLVPERRLRVYAFDPSSRGPLGSVLEVRLPYEPLEPGPVGSRVAVIDYDPAHATYYPAVDLEAPALVAEGGLAPRESDPRFHQQMAYAVASETLERFSFALGRPVRWRWTRAGRKDPLRNRLRIFPHALQEANAYYDRARGGLLFGYFPASLVEAGSNLPGQWVHTCLSHDIVVHETTHAVLDSVQPFFLENTGPDAAAFHEAFADLVALFQHFSYEDVLLETIRRTGGRMYATALAPMAASGPEGIRIQAELTESNPLVDLARQFGEAMELRAALRSALGTPPGSRRLAQLTEPHDRGAVLVAAVFDAYFSVYVRRTRDLLRLGRAEIGEGELHPDLAQRLCREAVKTARHFGTICIRALDYVPPVDIRFGDYLRALVTADGDLVPDDPWDYRGAIIAAFRSRGIAPEGAASFSEGDLRWPALDGGGPLRCAGLELDRRDRENSRRTAILLNAFGKRNARALGLTEKAPIQANRFHRLASQRIDPSGRLRGTLIAQLVQQRPERYEPHDPRTEFVFRGGTTLVMEEDGTVRYRISKPLDDHERLERQREFLRESLGGSPAATLTGEGPSPGGAIDLGILHRGY